MPSPLDHGRPEIRSGSSHRPAPPLNPLLADVLRAVTHVVAGVLRHADRWVEGRRQWP